MSRSAPAATSQKREHIRTFWLIGLFVLVIVGAVMAVIATVQGAQSSSPDSSGTSVSAVSGEFTAQTTDGEQVPVPGTKPSVLLFFSIECGVCGPATKMLAEVQRSAPEAANYVVVDVANYETAPEIESFLAEYEASSLGYTIDTDARLITAYEVSQLSTVVVLDASGQTVFSAVEPSEAQIRDALRQAGAE
ncbi:thioredoxin-like domain-containing protein [uncultured Microbacterium sp.]|jgi:thiol-disulfide isomerase/thioredoxin|uniref:TlpA family protein disulfide reductase n=1 Tax=uncultured Microbacterium sp. TaxID=191216 RepID=UPI00260CAC21|nr:thioredoxin-like domain-containing protein [uncultured Microbacterium sp.]